MPLWFVPLIGNSAKGWHVAQCLEPPKVHKPIGLWQHLGESCVSIFSNIEDIIKEKTCNPDEVEGFCDIAVFSTWRHRCIHHTGLLPSHTCSVLSCLPHTDHTGCRGNQAAWLLVHSSAWRTLPQLTIKGNGKQKVTDWKKNSTTFYNLPYQIKRNSLNSLNTAVSGSKLQTTTLYVPFARAGLGHQLSNY